MKKNEKLDHFSRIGGAPDVLVTFAYKSNNAIELFIKNGNFRNNSLRPRIKDSSLIVSILNKKTEEFSSIMFNNPKY